MVLEELVSVSTARKHPHNVMFLSLILSSVGIWIAYYMFEECASLLALAFSTVGFVPFMHNVLTAEEEEEAEHPGSAMSFLGRHSDLIGIYSWFFIGLLLSHTFWYLVLPENKVVNCIGDFCFPVPERDKVFAEQEKAWKFIRGEVTGNLSKAACLDSLKKDFWSCTLFIYSNNAMVLGLAVLLSFLYGAGAISLIEWNASVIGLFIGREILQKNIMSGIQTAIGYLPHGIPEIFAYFFGAIAGGIISVAITKGKYKTHEFETIAKDVFVLLVLAYIVLFIAALIESALIVGG